MGSLSKVLPSFVRLSYMVLPPRLLALYNEKRGLFRQGASVPEQCVLAAYIRSGEMARQVRRLRKDYQEKGNLMKELLLSAFGKDIEVSSLVSGVYCRVTLNSTYTAAELQYRAEKKGCRVLPIQAFYETQEQEERKEFLLSFSKIPSHSLKQAITVLHDMKYWKQQISQCESLIAEAEKQMAAVAERRGSIVERLSQMAKSDTYSKMLQEKENRKTILDGKIDVWLTMMYAQYILGEAQTYYEKVRQPLVIRNAGDYLRLMTQGRYTLQATFDGRQLFAID